MVLKMINATEAKVGTNILIDGEPYTVKRIDISKTGKHGASKARIEAQNIINNQKKIVVVPGHERFEVPMIDKRKGQVLAINEERVNIMDLESYENFDTDCPQEIRQNLSEGDNIEYWSVEGIKIIKRKV